MSEKSPFLSEEFRDSLTVRPLKERSPMERAGNNFPISH